MTDTLKDTAEQTYGQKLRVRVCGILIKENQILLARHDGLGDAGQLWIPPGGGVEFGEPLNNALQREFLEETGLAVEVKNLLMVSEFLKPPLHAIEFFFRVELISGTLKTGSDPEMPSQTQLLQEVRFWPLTDLKLMPAASLHPVLQNITSFSDLLHPKTLLYPAL